MAVYKNWQFYELLLPLPIVNSEEFWEYNQGKNCVDKHIYKDFFFSKSTTVIDTFAIKI